MGRCHLLAHGGLRLGVEGRVEGRVRVSDEVVLRVEGRVRVTG